MSSYSCHEIFINFSTFITKSEKKQSGARCQTKHTNWLIIQFCHMYRLRRRWKKKKKRNEPKKKKNWMRRRQMRLVTLKEVNTYFEKRCSWIIFFFSGSNLEFVSRMDTVCVSVHRLKMNENWSLCGSFFISSPCHEATRVSSQQEGVSPRNEWCTWTCRYTLHFHMGYRFRC